MPPEPQTRRVVIGSSQLISKYEAHISSFSSPKYLILVYSRQSGYPALETHSHASAYTDQGCVAYRSASHHACKPSSYILLLSRFLSLSWQMSQLRGMSPMQKYYHLPRVMVSCLPPTSRLCLSMIHARATIWFPSLHPRNEACMCRCRCGRGCVERDKISRGVCQGVRTKIARSRIFSDMSVEVCGRRTGARMY
jgi:hypothetical protein